MNLPSGYAETLNRAHLGVFKKGMQAFLDSVPRDACPYEDKRKPSGKLSWSRAYIRAWEDGWDWARDETQRQLQK